MATTPTIISSCSRKQASIPVESVKIKPDKIELVVGDTKKLIATILPENASNKKVTWISSDKNIATVDENGLVKAVKAGEAIITATTQDGGFKSTCEINVIKKVILVESIKLDKQTLELAEGQTQQLIATVLPENATNKEVTWESSDKNIVVVNQDGLVTAVNPGSAIITVKTGDSSGVTATCEIKVVDKAISVEGIQLDKSEFELTVGDALHLTATILPNNATNKKVTWESSNNSIATVDENGLVKAVAVGNATITVITEDGGKTTACQVKVIAKTISVEGIQLDKSEFELTVGDALHLTATILPNNATNKKVTWKSSDEKIAKVDQKGLVTAIGPGDATVTATTEDGDHTTTCKVYVEGTAVPVESVSINVNKLTIAVKTSEQLIAIILPEDAVNKNVTWESNNPFIATVDQNGLVEGVKTGNATITVTTQDGGFKSSCVINVVNSIPVWDASINKSTLELTEGCTEQLDLEIFPKNATNKKVTWSSSNDSVATVDQNGKVTAISIGETTITATTQDGSKTATCQVKVNQIPVESIQLDKKEFELSISQKCQLAATISPENATNKKVIWSSDDLSIAKVYQNGLVTGVGPGNTTITATTKDGFKVATCKVTVIFVPVESVKLDKTKLKLSISQTSLLAATVFPENVTIKNVIWASDDQSVVKVDQTGLVKAVSPGTATITVTTEDGSHKIATCEVTVGSFHVENVSLDKNKLTLVVGQNSILIATVSPEEATNKKVTWSSSDNDVATVDENGLVKAVRIGHVAITVTTEDGSKTATCKVTVRKPVPVQSIYLDKNELKLVEDETKQLTATILPAKATNKKTIWTSSNDSAATVSQNGLVKAVKPGNATITVTTQDGSKTAICNVVVKIVPVENIQLNRTNVELMLQSYDISKLIPTILPKNATNKNITWSSENKNIATVDQTGLVSAVCTGITNITVTTEDGGKTATCEIIVKSKKEIELTEGEVDQLPIILSESAINKEVTWSSNDPSIATVDNGGIVTGINWGNTTISAIVKDGNEVINIATYLVKVVPKIHPPSENDSEPIVHVQAVYFEKPKVMLTNTYPTQLKAWVFPETATNKKLIWTSSDPLNNPVDQSGVIDPEDRGYLRRVFITATAEDGGATATCLVDIHVINPINSPISVKSVKLDESKIKLKVGSTKRLIPTIYPFYATNRKVTWKSSDLSVATVDDNGQVSADQSGFVTAVGVGEATITAITNDGGYAATCKVEVIPKIHVQSARLDKKELDLIKDETNQLTATVLPKNASNKKIIWSTKNPHVAIVDKNGLVKAINPGIALIIATTQDGGFKATCKVKVSKLVHVESVLLNKNTLALSLNTSEQLTAEVLPTNATNKKVTWKSSNPFVATVDDNGLVTAYRIALGDTTITATTVDGGFTATCKVTVIFVPVKSVKLDKSKLELVGSETYQLKATVLPENATNKNVTWSSSDNYVAWVSPNGLVTPAAKGTATITATTVDGGKIKTATCEVSVIFVSVESVTLNKNELELVAGNTSQLIPTVLPKEATNKNVIWESSDSSIAKVNQNGLVTAVSDGETTITVITEDGEYIATCKIVTKPIPIESVQLDKNELELAVGQDSQLKATISPENATNKNVFWLSDNPSVATVDQNGKVTAVSDGIAIIVVSTIDGNKKAVCEVIVTK